MLATHPAVAEVGVAGVPGAAKGEVAKAWVVLRTGERAEVEELRGFCRERLAPTRCRPPSSSAPSCPSQW